MGKLPAEEIKKMLECIKKDKRVMMPPTIGYDAGVHLLGDTLVAVATDPCTGVPEEWFGWLLINYAASDIALFGAKPQFCTINLLGPPSTEFSRFQKVMAQTCRAAEELDIAIVRGHTGMYESLNDLLGVCTVYGKANPWRLITPPKAKAGDLILCTKPLGLETAINFSFTHKEQAQNLFGQEKQRMLSGMVRMQGCVKEALALSGIRGVHVMHDATEGGFAAALSELGEASKMGFRVELEALPITQEVRALQSHFQLTDTQVLSMSSTGTILGAVAPKAKQKVEAALQNLGLTASFVGEFTEYKERILVRRGVEVAFPSQADDPYTRLLTS